MDTMGRARQRLANADITYYERWGWSSKYGWGLGSNRNHSNFPHATWFSTGVEQTDIASKEFYVS
jgi:hypothetical protein